MTVSICRKLIHTSLSAVILCSVARAQVGPAPATAPKPSGKSPVGVTVYDRARVDTWQWFEAPPASETYTYTQNLLRIAMMQKVKHWDWQLELAQTTILGVPKDAVLSTAQGQLGLGGTYYAANGNNTTPVAAFFKQGFARYHFNGADRTLRIGRFEFNEGTETTPKDKTIVWLQANRIAARLVGNFGFSNAQRSLDGLDAHYGVKNVDVTLLAARADQGVYNMNGNPELNVDLQYGAVTQSFLKGHALWRAFGIGYHDGRTRLVKTDNRPLAVRKADIHNIRIGTYGGDLLLTAPAGPGKVDLLLWGALQNGQWGVQSHSASAGAIEGGYQFDKVALQPWFRAGEFRSSGDGNPTDNKHNTFFQILPTPRTYARDPFFNLMNLNNQFISTILKPSPKVNVRSDLQWLQLSNANDFWYLGGGAFDNKVFGYVGRPSGGKTSFASLYDISTDWAVAKQFDMNFYYAHVWGKSVIGALYPRDKNSNFGYVEFIYHWGLQQKTK